MPTLAQGDQGHPTVVAACIPCGKGLATRQVGHRIHSRHPVVEERGAQAKGPQPGPAADLPGEGRQGEHGHEMETIDRAQHRIGLHIRRQALGEKTGGQEPTGLGTPQPPQPANGRQGAVGIGGRIHMEVMLLMVGFPPARPHLASRSRHQGANPGHGLGGLVAAMGNEAVVDRRGGKHPDGVEPKGPKRGTQA